MDTGADYLVGAILPCPDGIGAEDAQILFAGGQPVFDHAPRVDDALDSQIVRAALR